RLSPAIKLKRFYPTVVLRPWWIRWKRANDMAQKKSEKDFESALNRLEEITDQLESGESNLDESLALYTEGIELAGFCNKKLTEAEKKIKIIKEQNQQLIEVDFDEE
ncbi:MAG: exodeoxyribonuclease VII small subunit, partial [Candidatus Zixiibacteriota bacterium]